MKVDACVWQFGVDYPGAQGDDSKLPIRSVTIKAWDEVYWMSTFDDHAAAVSGAAQIAKLVSTYRAQGIDLLLWCVPKGRNVSRMLALSKACLDVPGVKGLVFDVEPYSGFCAGDCLYLGQTLMKQVRAARPKAWLGIHYDPRAQHWASSGTSEWLKYCDGALPMVYWRTFAGQGVWSTPNNAVAQAYSDLRNKLAPGRDIEYFPILQGNAPAAEVKAGIQTALAKGSRRVSLWRRGVVASATWSAIATIPEPAPPPPPPPPPDPCADIKKRLTACQSEVASLKTTVARRDATIEQRDGTIARLKGQITDLNEDLQTAKQALDGCSDRLQELAQVEEACAVIKDFVANLPEPD